MKLLLQIGIVFGLYWISQCIEVILPFPFPASVISLLLLLLLLILKIVKADCIREKAEFMLGNLTFFFVPVTLGVLNYMDLIMENAVAFFTMCFVSMVLTYGATVWTVRLTCRWLEKRKEAAR